MTTKQNASSTAARAMQKLSAKTRWGRLGAAARAEVMRTVRRMGIKKNLAESEKPSAITRARKTKNKKAKAA